MAWKTKIPYRLIDFSSRIHPSDNYVIGVKRISDSGGAGTWIRIDENDNAVEVENNYFYNHPSYQFEQVSMPFVKSTEPEEIGYNIFIKVPKFYIKSDGNTRFWISPIAKDGFHCHPAFMSNKQEIDEIYVGKYQGFMWNGKMHSIPENIYVNESDENDVVSYQKIKPTVYVSFEECKAACEKWNSSSESGAVQIQGYHMFSIHELSALQWLSLIEIASTNAAIPVDKGGFGIGRLFGTSLYDADDDKATMVDNIGGVFSSACDFHGIIGLWGNIWEFIDGIKVSADNKIAIWDNNGAKLWKYTDVDVPFKKREAETWSPGETMGFYKNRVLYSAASASSTDNQYDHDTADLFIPDFTSLVSDYRYGCYSDGVFTRVKSSFETNVAVGGGFDAGEYGGLYSYRFDIQHPRTQNYSTGEGVDYGDKAGDIGTRLCFARVNPT